MRRPVGGTRRAQGDQEDNNVRTDKIKIDKALLAKVKRYADIAGYSSVEEFITHALEKEMRSSRRPTPRRRSRSG